MNKSMRYTVNLLAGFAILVLAGCTGSFQGTPTANNANSVTGPVVLTPGQPEVYTGCAVPSPNPTGHVYYSDPVNGSMNGDGSAAHPWAAFSILASSSVFPPSASAIVKAGDTVQLLSGSHGIVAIGTSNNSDFITVTNAPGQIPVLTSLNISGGQKWIFSGLTIVELNNGTTGNPGNLAGLTLGVDGSGSPSENIIIDNNAIVSQYNVSTWTQQDWQNKALSHAITEGWGGDCTAITNNKISNVGFGIAVNGTHVLVHGNTIDHFGDDGIDLGVESGTQVLANIEVSGNTITNNLNIGDANHNDAFQGWVLNGTTATNIVVDSNTIMVQTDPTLPWVGDMQGISEFDGAWSNVTVSNNVVLGGAYHGIAFYDATNLTVVNNTVFGTWGQPASNGDMNECWIGIFGGSNITVRNNVTDMISIASGVMVTQDHNLVTTSHPAVFNSFNLGTLDFDLHPLASASLLIGEGSPTLAPSKDITGATRSGSITIGAYQNP